MLSSSLSIEQKCLNPIRCAELKRARVALPAEKYYSCVASQAMTAMSS